MRAGSVGRSVRAAFLFLLAGAATVIYGQPDFRKHNFTFGIGAGIPQMELEPFFRTRPAIRVGYGYRFFRYGQIDVGLDTVFQAADVVRFQNVGFGFARIRDFEFMLPMGGRAILPLGDDKFQLYGGGGAAWLTYRELLRQPSDFYRLDCFDCSAKSGWGYYATAGGSVALDRGQHFRLGAGVRMYRANTSGFLPVSGLPETKTRDKWFNVFGEFTFSF